MTVRQKKLCWLRIFQILLLVLIAYEIITALRLTVYNLQIVCNEQLRFVEASEESYVTTYEDLSFAKAGFKDSNAIAALPFVGRIVLYIATGMLFAMVTKTRNRVLRSKRSKKTARVPVATVTAKSSMGSVSPRVDVARFYN